MKSLEEDNQMLCPTDVAARGIDVDNITHVVNYQLPDEIETLYRSGRKLVVLETRYFYRYCKKVNCVRFLLFRIINKNLKKNSSFRNRNCEIQVIALS
jgi:hypothetical protein